MSEPVRRLNWNGVWQEFANATFEDGDFDDALIVLSGLESGVLLPAADHVRSLLAMAMDPLSCTNDRKGFANRPDAESEDPFALSINMIQQHAISLLRAWTSDDGEAILRALPGHAEPTSMELLGRYDQSTPSLPSPVSKKSASITAKGKGKGKNKSDPEEAGDDAPIHAAGRRIGRCQDVWAVLGGSGLKKVHDATDQEPMPPTAWELLEVLLDAWEFDAERGENEHWSRQFLRQFEKPASAPRKNFKVVFQIIFGPFLPTAESLAAQHALDIDRMRRSASRLLGLLFDLAGAGLLDINRFTQEMTIRMHDLSLSSIRIFLAHLPPAKYSIRAKILTYYIDSYCQKQSSSANSSQNKTASMSPRKLSREGSQSSSNTLGVPKPPDAALPAPHIILQYLSRLPAEITSDTPIKQRQKAIDQLDAMKLALVHVMNTERGSDPVWQRLINEGAVEQSLEVARAQLSS